MAQNIHKLVIVILYLFWGISLDAQKPSLDLSSFNQWTSVESPAISNDGRYALYMIRNQPIGKETLVIKATDNDWQEQLPDCRKAQFSKNSQIAVFFKTKDTLCILKLGTSVTECIPNVSSFILPKENLGEWIFVLSNSGDLIVRNLETKQQNSYPSVIDYQPNEKRQNFLLQTRSPKDSVIRLEIVDLISMHSSLIWKGSQANHFILDSDGKQLAFSATTQLNGKTQKNIYYYKQGDSSAKVLIDNDNTKFYSGLTVDDAISFDQNGANLFFTLSHMDSLLPEIANAPKVDVWSYSDPKLQSQQLNEAKYNYPKNYTFAITISNHHIVRLENENEEIIRPPGGYINLSNNYLLVIQKGDGDLYGEWTWNKSALNSIYLLSTMTGERKLIGSGLPILTCKTYVISPTGKYIVYYDMKSQSYFSYTITSGIVRNISSSIHTKWTTYIREDEPMSAYEPIGIAGWLKHDEGVLIYDQNDIYQLDLSTNTPALNLTNGYGRDHGIVFKIAIHSISSIDPTEQLLLSAFNRNNKEDGFFQLVMKKEQDPKLLIMQPYVYEGNNEMEFEMAAPLKAKDANIYIVRRMEAKESPNYFITNNFHEFTPLSNVHPEHSYNWLTTQLITWKSLDGKVCQGILYKPENFNPQKRYPIIFYYYEKLSNGLHGFLQPQATTGPLNIPYYVSNGYLVFTPDIHYDIGHPGRSALSSILSAASLLSKFPWVNTSEMGIQGQSFGAYETDYIVTHTKIFAAACASSGWSDFVSASNDVRYGGNARLFYYEMFRERMGTLLWNRPDLYIESSPIFQVDKVTTPILLMNNKNDQDVSFTQGIEFFTALRRLGKRSWMLQYDEGHHTLLDNKSAIDLTIRMKQFFDHFLQGGPSPKWMAEGIPAKLKGVDLGYELEPISTKQANTNLLIIQSTSN